MKIIGSIVCGRLWGQPKFEFDDVLWCVARDGFSGTGGFVAGKVLLVGGDLGDLVC